MADVRYGGTQSHSRRLCTLKIFGTSEVLQIPIEVTTKVLAVRQLVSSRFGLEPESLTFVVKAASSTRVLRDPDEIPSQALGFTLDPCSDARQGLQSGDGRRCKQAWGSFSSSNRRPTGEAQFAGDRSRASQFLAEAEDGLPAPALHHRHRARGPEAGSCFPQGCCRACTVSRALGNHICAEFWVSKRARMGIASEALEDGIQDFVIYDKLGRIGGAAWVINANPTSKLQTELGVYHLQYDPECLVPKALRGLPRNKLILERGTGAGGFGA